MEFNHLQMYLRLQFSRDEIAEEFGILRPTVEREINVGIGKEKKKKRGDDREKEKRIQSKPENTSR